MSESEKTVSYEQCVEEVRRMAWRTALLHHYFGVTMIEELGEEKARPIITEAIRRYGEHIGRMVKDGRGRTRTVKDGRGRWEMVGTL